MSPIGVAILFGLGILIGYCIGLDTGRNESK